MPRREGNNPKRRIAPRGEIDIADLERFARRARYLGSAHLKRSPADWGFNPPTNPRPHKSLCDGSGAVRRREASALLREGFLRGMVGGLGAGGLPKYVWSVDSRGRVYEAKIGRDGRGYHGYELGRDDEAMRRRVMEEWRARCETN